MARMQGAYTYDTGHSADIPSGIKLKASEPLSPNAFVQIPVDDQPAQSVVHTPVSRQKKMRVPRGGSVERPVQRTPHRQAPSVSLEEARSNPVSPSLHIVLEDDQDHEPSRADDQPESLAQFVASFPKIPDGLIFQTSEDEPYDERSQDYAEPDAHDDRSALDDNTMTIRLDEGELPEPESEFRAEPYVFASTPKDDLQRTAPRASNLHSSEHLMTDVNPRFEKMIRDASSHSMGTQTPGRASADIPQRASSGRGMASGGRAFSRRSPAVSGSVGGMQTAGVRGGAAAAAMAQPAFGRTSGPLPQRTPICSASLLSRTSKPVGYASGNLPHNAGRFGRTSANIPSPVNGTPASRSGAALPSSGQPGGFGAPTASGNPARPFASASPSSPSQSPFMQSAPSAGPASAGGGGSSVIAGKPLLDPHAIEESTIFDEPPIPISVGMKNAEKSRLKGRKLAFIGAALVIVVIAVGAFFMFGRNASLPIPEITITTTNPGGSDSDAGANSSSGAGSDASSSGASGASGAGDNAGSSQEGGAGAADATGGGSVTYKYAARTPSGIEYTVEENTTFDAQGNCTFTTMKMQFPTEEAVKDFTDSLARDLGTKYTLDSMNGANATVTVDNSALGLNREDYENALRYSVDDLVILKK